MKKLAVIPGDPIFKYHDKGEIKTRYWNPGDIFDEVHIVSLCDRDIAPDMVQDLAGRARLYIHAVGRPSALSLPSGDTCVLDIYGHECGSN